MSIAEANLVAKSWLNNQELEWDRARSVISEVRNAGLIARGGKITGAMMTSPSDVKKLSFDKPKGAISEDAAKPPKQLYELAEKCGVINKERKSLKEIFKAS